jgi:hypothetical protein
VTTPRPAAEAASPGRGTAAPDGPRRRGLAAMLEARSVAVVGASDRPGSFGCLAVDALVLPARAGRTDAAPGA